MDLSDTQTDWGTHRPRPLDRTLLAGVRLGLGRGAVKRLLRALWMRHGGPRPVDVRYRGLRLRLYPADNAIDAKILFSSRLRERTELSWLRRYAVEGAFVDIGANSGYYTLMACRFGYGRVIAIEPNPLMLPRLRFNVAANGFDSRVSVLGCALGPRAGRLTLNVPLGSDMGGASLSDSGEAGTATLAVEVTVRTLADVVGASGLAAIGALKIDVEGLEDAVLLPYLDATPPRMWPGLLILEHTGSRRWGTDLLERLRAEGYREMARSRGNVVLARSRPRT